MLARQNRADIHLLHVVPGIDATFRSYISAEIGEGQLDKFEREHEGTAREKIKWEIEHFAKTELANYPEDLKRFVGTIVRHGDPVVEILRVADEIHAICGEGEAEPPLPRFHKLSRRRSFVSLKGNL